MKLIKPEKYLLFYLSRDHSEDGQGQVCAKVYKYISNKVTLIDVFYAREIEAFIDFIKAHNKKPALVLVESEEFVIQSEKIPYLLGLDRLSIINRKIIHALPPESIAYYYSKGRSSRGDKQETILVLGMADSATWLPWILPMRESGLLIKAVTTPTLVSSSSAKSAGLTDAHGALIIQVAWNYGGVSQTVLERGLPIFSRFFSWTNKPISNDIKNFTKGWDVENAKNECIVETKKLLSFLQGRGLWSPTLRTPIIIIVPANLADVKLSFPEIQGIDWKVVVAPSQNDKYSTAKNGVGVINYGAEILFIEQLVNLGKISIQCGQTSIRYSYLNWLFMRYSVIVLGLIFVIALLMTGYYGLGYLFQTNKNSDLQSQIDNNTKQYKGLSDSFPKIGISNEELRQADYLTRILEKCHPGFPNFAKDLAKINLAHQQIEFLGFSWQQGFSKNSKIKDEVELVGEPEVECSGSYTIAGNIIALPQNSQRDLQNIFLSWQRKIMDLGANVEVKSPPLDLTQGRYSENSLAPPKAKFEIVVRFLN